MFKTTKPQRKRLGLVAVICMVICMLMALALNYAHGVIAIFVSTVEFLSGLVAAGFLWIWLIAQMYDKCGGATSAGKIKQRPIK